MSVAIVGCPRSGTTLLYAMIRAAVTADWKTFDREKSARIQSGKVITKRPWDVFNPDILHALVQTIMVVRDPRAILCSTHPNQPDDWFIHANWGWIATRDGRREPEAPGLLEYFKRMEAIRDQVDAVVYFEQLVVDPIVVGGQLAQSTELEFARPLGDGLEDANPGPRLARAMKGVRPPDPDRIRAWRDQPSRVCQQFRAFPKLHDHLYRWGYESDGKWFKEVCGA